MTDSIEIMPVSGPLDARIRPPGSKSITNRALVCAALAEGDSELRGALDSEDTRVMIAALGELGIQIESADAGRTLNVAGCDGQIPAHRADLFVANSGTTMRFLTALAALGNGDYRLDGIARMRERPIGDLIEALEALGATIQCKEATGCPPLIVRGHGLHGGQAEIKGNVSSQFLSALMMAAPYAEAPVELGIVGGLVSAPYVSITQRVMKSFGGEAIAAESYGWISIANDRRYRGQRYEIEPDASAASYFFAAAAIAGGRVTVEGLSRHSLQGDIAFCECLKAMGARVTYESNSITVEGDWLKGIDVDMNAISDTVQTLAVTALFADGPTRIRNVGHIRHKETDRLAATAAELRKLGAAVEEMDDGLAIIPGPLQGAEIDTYNDHRMAMSFALAGLKTAKVVIRDPGCVEKTYPAFFADLRRATGS
jgi:3-phosphoshikimate 1-carboxyvinyltransferase